MHLHKDVQAKEPVAIKQESSNNNEEEKPTGLPHLHTYMSGTLRLGCSITQRYPLRNDKLKLSIWVILAVTVCLGTFHAREEIPSFKGGDGKATALAISPLFCMEKH